MTAPPAPPLPRLDPTSRVRQVLPAAPQHAYSPVPTHTHTLHTDTTRQHDTHTRHKTTRATRGEGSVAWTQLAGLTEAPMASLPSLVSALVVALSSSSSSSSED